MRCLIPILITAFSLPACATMTMGHFNTYQTAQTVPPGKVVTGVGFGALRYSLPVGGPVYVMFSPEGWLRYGLSDRGEIGFRAYPIGLSLDGKALLYDGGTKGVAIALAPGLGFSRIDTGSGQSSSSLSSVMGFLSVIFSVPVEGGHFVYFGPKAMYGYLSNSSSPSDLRTRYIGGFIGAAIKKGKLFIMPELSLLEYTTSYTIKQTTYGPYGSSSTTSTVEVSGNVIFPGVGISVAF